MKYRLKGLEQFDVMDTVLNNRGLTKEEANEIMNPTVSEHDPFIMKNVSRGINILKNAIDKEVKIGILVDTDVDGLTSSAIIQEFITNELNHKNVEMIRHIERVKAHGIDSEVKERLEVGDIDLLIIPDAGSGLGDYEAIIELTNKITHTIILDHHEVEHPKTEKNITLINPHQKDCEYPNKNLSGCGVTYKFIQAYSKENGIDIGHKFTDLVALSLVSDMMDMRSLENRILLTRGSYEENLTSPLMKEFMLSKNIVRDYISIQEYAFVFGSLMNSCIRVGSDENKEMLLKACYSKELVKSNKRGSFGELEIIQDEIIRRIGNDKAKQTKMVKAAVDKIKKNTTITDDKVAMIDVSEVDKSISGLIANQLMNDFFKKSVMLYRVKKDETLIGGSARGYGDMDFKEICNKTELFDFCSGHSRAFGYEFKANNIQKIQEALNEELKNLDIDDSVVVDGVYDKVVPLTDIKQVVEYEKLFCNDIPEPLFIIKDVALNTGTIKKIGNATYQFKIDKINCVKEFCSKVWIENFTLANTTLPFGGDLTADILVKFKKNSKGYYYLDIVNAVSKEIEYEF